MRKIILNLWFKVRFFIYSQPFHEGLKITIAVLLPLLIFGLMGQLHYGVSIAIGCILASTPDLVGPYRERRKSMLLTAILIFFISMLTRILPFSDVFLGLFISIFTFACCMLTAYGIRAMGIGAACLFALFFNLTLAHEDSHPIVEALLISAGAIWYMLFVLSIRSVKPYRISQQVLGDCAYKIANLLRIKSDFFNPDKAIGQTHKRVIQANVVLSQRQEDVRAILFSSATDRQYSSHKYRQLTFIFVNVMDLFERINASHHDYYQVREKFGHTQAYRMIPDLLVSCAEELEHLATSITVLKAPKNEIQFSGKWDKAYAVITALEKQEEGSAIVLKKMLINIRYVMAKIREIHSILSKSEEIQDQSELLAHKERFFKQPQFSWPQLQAHLNLSSPIFRHALRVSIVMLIAFIITKALPIVFPEYIALTKHSFWLYITIIVILRPGFSLSKQRSFDRLKGSLLGGGLGLLSILLITNQVVLLILMFVYILLTFSLIRTKYMYGALFLTAFFLIGYFFFTGVDDYGFLLLQERILDTIIGCLLSYLSFYVILPTWESNSIKGYLNNAVKSNIHFLNLIFNKFAGIELGIADYKLGRKDVYLSLAELNALHERILSEPSQRRPFTKELNDFSVYTHLLVSYAMAFVNILEQNPMAKPNDLNLHRMNAIISNLFNTSQLFDSAHAESMKELPHYQQAIVSEVGDTGLIQEQLDLMLHVVQQLYRCSLDIKLLANRTQRK